MRTVLANCSKITFPAMGVPNSTCRKQKRLSSRSSCAVKGVLVCFGTARGPDRCCPVFDVRTGTARVYGVLSLSAPSLIESSTHFHETDPSAGFGKRWSAMTISAALSIGVILPPFDWDGRVSRVLLPSG